MQISTSNLCFVPLDLRSPWVNCCVDGVLCGHIVLKRLMLQRHGKQLHELMRLFLVYQPALQTTRWRYNGDTKWRQRGCHQIFKVDKFSFTILSRIFSWVQKLSRRSRHCLAKRNRWHDKNTFTNCWRSWLRFVEHLDLVQLQVIRTFQKVKPLLSSCGGLVVHLRIWSHRWRAAPVALGGRSHRCCH